VRPILVLIIAVAAVISCNRAAPKPSDSPSASSSVTPVKGPSWLQHLRIAIPETHLGQMGGTATAPETARREPQLAEHQMAQALAETFELTGADVYRIDCRSCHGPEGDGAPPEIRSLIGPAQGTSPALIERRMEQRGAPISEAMAAQLASQAEQTIRDRLQHGGEKMPSLGYLRPEEVAALLGYLRQLAGAPGTEHVTAVKESGAHVGEQVIKGTCHICHDATGPGGTRMMTMMRGIIPSLASLPGDHSLEEVIRQVQYGTRMMMMMRGNRMPPFPYFTDEETAAAYLYLQAYPPTK
jgi:mono/diheme cytochrome c family protein